MADKDLTPGADDARFRDVDGDHDYEAAAGEWDGEPATAEATLDAIRDDATATRTGDEAAVEGRIQPAGESKNSKRFVFAEPDTTEAVDAVATALVEADHFGLVEAVVDEPEMYRQRWDRDLTELEREVLWQLCCQFVHAEQIVPLHVIEQAEQQLRDTD